MSDTPTTVGFPEAARRLGVSLRILRRAIRAGRIAAPARLSAIASLPAAWLAEVQAAVAADPTLLRAVVPQQVPAYARYRGTSAWHKYPRRVREFARVRAERRAAAATMAA